MKIDFDNMELQVIPAFKGGLKEYKVKTFLDNQNRIMKGCLAPGASIGLHRHEGTSETMFFLSGSGYVLCNGTKQVVEPGSCHYCAENEEHTLINDGTEDLVFYAIVPQHHIG